MRDGGSGRYALAALDMDGTLLNSRHEMTPFTRDALARASAAGKHIALCTGRCMSELWGFFDACPGVGYAIGENGGCLYDVRAGRMLYQLTIPEDEARAVFDLTRDFDVCVQCFIGGQSYLPFSGEAALAPYHVADFVPVFDAGSKYVGDVIGLALERGGVEKINLYFTGPEDKAEFWKRLSAFDLFAADSLGHGIEMSPKEASKSEGLRRLCAHLGIPLSAAMAVGDGGNDMDLMRSAGLGVAMGNATDGVKAAARALTDDCDRDGAAKAVLRYLLGENV